MKILAIETATEACSAALLNDDSITFRFDLAPREHTKLILPMMDEVLKQSDVTLKDVDAIAFGRGPGAFTGLRIAAGVAQGAALSVDIPVVPVSTLAALAMQVNDTKNEAVIFAALDARMGEVYWGAFRIKEGCIQTVEDEQVSSPKIMLGSVKKYQQVIAIGPGWDAYNDQLIIDKPLENITYIPNALPSAEQVAQLAQGMITNGDAVPAEDAQPVYLRNNVAKKSTKIG